MNCDKMETSRLSSRCRRKARVRVKGHFTWHGFRTHDFDVIRCWPHYLEFEEQARATSSTLHIESADVIK